MRLVQKSRQLSQVNFLKAPLLISFHKSGNRPRVFQGDTVLLGLNLGLCDTKGHTLDRHASSVCHMNPLNAKGGKMLLIKQATGSMHQIDEMFLIHLITSTNPPLSPTKRAGSHPNQAEIGAAKIVKVICIMLISMGVQKI